MLKSWSTLSLWILRTTLLDRTLTDGGGTRLAQAMPPIPGTWSQPASQAHPIHPKPQVATSENFQWAWCFLPMRQRLQKRTGMLGVSTENQKHQRYGFILLLYSPSPWNKRDFHIHFSGTHRPCLPTNSPNRACFFREGGSTPCSWVALGRSARGSYSDLLAIILPEGVFKRLLCPLIHLALEQLQAVPTPTRTGRTLGRIPPPPQQQVKVKIIPPLSCKSLPIGLQKGKSNLSSSKHLTCLSFLKTLFSPTFNLTWNFKSPLNYIHVL